MHLSENDASDDLPLSIKELLAGLPTAAILEGEHGELQVLLPATAKPLVCSGDGGGALVLTFDRGDEQWISNVGGVPYYLYPVHPSKEFLSSPSLAGTIYLFVLR